MSIPADGWYDVQLSPKIPGTCRVRVDSKGVSTLDQSWMSRRYVEEFFPNAQWGPRIEPPKEEKP